VNRRRVAVVGGGITGLAAALALEPLAATGALEVTLLERSTRLGGVLTSHRVQGQTVEEGPDSFLARKPAGRAFAQAVGLQACLEGPNPAVRGSYLVRDGRLVPLPEGLVAGVPSDLQAIARTPALSAYARLRAVAGLLRPGWPELPAVDLSVGAILTERLGRAYVDGLAAPLLAGIYAGRVDDLSVDGTLPELRRLAGGRGTLLGRAAAMRRAARSRSDGPVFLTPRDGMGDLAQKAAARLRAVTVRLCAEVRAVRGRTAGGFDLALADGGALQADGVLCCVPAAAASRVLAGLPDVASALAAIRHATLAVVAFVLPPTAVTRPLDRTGFLVPEGEGMSLTACTWLSAKFLHGRPPQEPPAAHVLRAFVGRASAPPASSDVALADAAWREVAGLMGIAAEPAWRAVYRFPEVMPQIAVGHAARRAAVEAAAAAHPGLAVAGNYLDGVGVPDCIRAGRQAAEALAARLTAA
jgi:oxygen-dependent protoporphyrinogen oxidase